MKKSDKEDILLFIILLIILFLDIYTIIKI